MADIIDFNKEKKTIKDFFEDSENQEDKFLIFESKKDIQEAFDKILETIEDPKEIINFGVFYSSTDGGGATITRCIDSMSLIGFIESIKTDLIIR